MDINWLDDQKVKLQLIRVSHYLLAYELLLSSVVDGVRDFYLTVFKDGELTYSDRYKTDVLSKAKHVFEASLIWLKEHNVISGADVESLNEIR